MASLPCFVAAEQDIISNQAYAKINHGKLCLMMDTVLLIAALAVIEVLMFFLRNKADQREQESEETSLALLIPAHVPRWIGSFRNLWFAFHWAIIVALIPFSLLFAAIGKKGQFKLPNAYFHGVNFLLLAGLCIWLSL